MPFFFFPKLSYIARFHQTQLFTSPQLGSDISLLFILVLVLWLASTTLVTLTLVFSRFYLKSGLRFQSLSAALTAFQTQERLVLSFPFLSSPLTRDRFSKRGAFHEMLWPREAHLHLMLAKWLDTWHLRATD